MLAHTNKHTHTHTHTHTLEMFPIVSTLFRALVELQCLGVGRTIPEKAVTLCGDHGANICGRKEIFQTCKRHAMKGLWEALYTLCQAGDILLRSHDLGSRDKKPHPRYLRNMRVTFL